MRLPRRWGIVEIRAYRRGRPLSRSRASRVQAAPIDLARREFGPGVLGMAPPACYGRTTGIVLHRDPASTTCGTMPLPWADTAHGNRRAGWETAGKPRRWVILL